MTLSQYIAGLKGHRVDVIGAGISNRPLIRLLLRAGISVCIHDRSSSEGLGDFYNEALSAGAVFSLGEAYLDDLSGDTVFRTPGLHPFHPSLIAAKKRGAVVTSEMEVFLGLCPCRVIAVTGSDGKTTVTSILAELFRAAGFKTWLGGNIGHPLLSEVDAMSPEDMVVLELSSFQLHSMDCRPDVAVITNLSPNHLDVHPDYRDYVDAKRQIYRNQRPDARLVLNADNVDTAACAADAKGHVVWFSRTHAVEEGAYLREDGYLCVNGAPLLKKNELLIPGIHNVENMLTAFAAADGYVSHAVMKSVASTFQGVPHRLQIIRRHNRVTYINDSIASSPNRTIAGLSCFSEKVILIAGGKDKGLSFDELGSVICARVKSLYLTGMTAEAIKNAVVNAAEYRPGSPEILVNDDFDETVLSACRSASPGDTVLLSPASTSFDRFRNFEERGEAFVRIVEGIE